MEFQGSAIAALAIVAAVGILAASLFMWIGAKIARVVYATFGRAIVAAVAAGFITWLASVLLLELGVTNNVIGFLVGLALTLVVVKAAFNTSLGKALLVWVFNVLAQIAALYLGTMLFGVDVAARTVLL